MTPSPYRSAYHPERRMSCRLPPQSTLAAVLDHADANLAARVPTVRPAAHQVDQRPTSPRRRLHQGGRMVARPTRRAGLRGLRPPHRGPSRRRRASGRAGGLQWPAYPVLRPLRRAAGRSVSLWHSDPFDPQYVDGPRGKRFVARGAVDDKGQTADVPGGPARLAHAPAAAFLPASPC